MKIYSMKSYFIDIPSFKEVVFIKHDFCTLFPPHSQTCGKNKPILLISSLWKHWKIGRLKAVVNQYRNPWPVLSQAFLDKSLYLFVSQFLIYKAKTMVLAVSLPFCLFFQTVSLFGKEVWGLFNNNVAYYNKINS